MPKYLTTALSQNRTDIMNQSFLVYFLLFSSIMFTSCDRQEVKQMPVGNTENVAAITSNTKMVKIPGGKYKPFYGSDTSMTTVTSFLIDVNPVTNGEFLEFVKTHPEWQRSNIKRLYADSNYLKDWISDTALPKDIKADAPVCNVSWYAAKAFAKAVGKRLPTLDEWEFVAMTDETTDNARSKKSYSDHIIDQYLIKNRQFNQVRQSKANYWGVYNMFDLVWEWTDDFNSVLMTLESRGGDYSDNNLFCAGGATSATDILNYAAFMRFSMRAGLKANYTVANLGFRCAINMDSSALGFNK